MFLCNLLFCRRDLQELSHVDPVDDIFGGQDNFRELEASVQVSAHGSEPAVLLHRRTITIIAHQEEVLAFGRAANGDKLIAKLQIQFFIAGHVLYILIISS